MKSPPASRTRRLVAIALLLGWMAAIFGGSSRPAPPAVTDLRIPDWILHGVEYGVLGFLLSRCLGLETRRTSFALLVVLPGALALLYGLTDEIHQSFVPSRDPSLHDLAADLVGGLVGGLVYRTLRLRRRRAAAPAAAIGALALLLLPRPLLGSPEPEDAVAAAEREIRSEDLRATAEFLASDALRGREAPSPELDIAARYLAERFRALGLEPGGRDGSWFQTVPMSFRRERGGSRVRLLAEGKVREFAGEDVAVPRQAAEGLGAGPLVFAGYGVVAPDLGRDDYAGIDVRGRTVLVFDGLPGRLDPKSPFRSPKDRGVAGQRTLAGKAAIAARHGAVGLLVVGGPLDGTVDRVRLVDGDAREGELTTVEGGYRLLERGPARLPVDPGEVERVELSDGTVVALRGGGAAEELDLPVASVERFYAADRVAAVEEDVVPLPRGDLGSGWLPGGRPPAGPLPVLRISARAARGLLDGSGREDLGALQESVDAKAGSFALTGRVGVVRVATEIESRPSRNVLARVPGRERTDEIVLVTAHYDHVGTGETGEIYHGADDNASGTAALLGVAQALAALPARPARPVLLVALTAEERGLVGSRAFVADPPVGLDDVLAELNTDMVGRGPTEEMRIFVGPLGTDLGGVLRRAAAAAGVAGIFEIAPPPDGRVPPPGNRAGLDLPVPKTESNYFGRSDHATFYRKGIPTAFLFGGMHADYHRPTDTADRLNPEKMAAASRLVFRAACRLAEDGLPRTDGPAK